MRWSAFIAAFAFLVLALGGAIWLRASLASAFARGEAYGRALAAAEAGEALAEHGAALAAVRQKADREAAALQAERDHLREKLDDLGKLLAPVAVGADDGAARCFDAGVVRALDEIRRSGASPGAP